MSNPAWDMGLAEYVELGETIPCLREAANCRKVRTMIRAIFCVMTVLSLAACNGVAVSGGGAEAGNAAATGAAPEPKLTPAQRAAVGKRIWQNECAGTVEGLTTWNVGEDFPSLGIGHTLWFPAGHREPFTETFPQLARYLESRGKPAPVWARPPAPCPWPDRASFQRDFNSPRMKELRAWLASTITEQTDFLIARQRAALPKILEECPPQDRAVVRARFLALQAVPEGQFALIDYVNFKGEGINPRERYQGQGWGLLQVLQNMKGQPKGQAAVAEFARSAEATLMRRIELSPPARGEQRWSQGWKNRCRSYNRPL